ncbi:uncharacterized protein LOC111622406 [Centruroides sculpturatus]|uniref:uncharacterized protein LOC111622406 n=1 Tax=Centruroides sculpturatus TaxID=218467 RepID=UPI000C6E7905|nr:uncharacterized protein LOC111622406 [Centruroides sculpturatus]
MEGEKEALVIDEDSLEIDVVSEDCLTSRPVKIPRPPNAFLLFSQDYRKKFSEQNPTESNKMISIRLGNAWRMLSKEQKEEYFEKAKICEYEHRLKYPDYQYNPFVARKRKQQMKEERQKSKQMRETNEDKRIAVEKLDKKWLHQKQDKPAPHIHTLPSSIMSGRSGIQNSSSTLNSVPLINQQTLLESKILIQTQQREQTRNFQEQPHSLVSVDGKYAMIDPQQHLYIFQPNQIGNKKIEKTETTAHTKIHESQAELSRDCKLSAPLNDIPLVNGGRIDADGTSRFPFHSINSECLVQPRVYTPATSYYHLANPPPFYYPESYYSRLYCRYPSPYFYNYSYGFRNSLGACPSCSDPSIIRRAFNYQSSGETYQVLSESLHTLNSQPL